MSTTPLEQGPKPPDPPLRVLGDPAATAELELVSELFHRINRIIPPDQQIQTVGPQTPVKAAVAIMAKRGFSQIPVAVGEEILGVFTYRGFARAMSHLSLDALNKDKLAPGDLPVDEFLEKFTFAQVSDEMRSVFEAIDRDDAVLIGNPSRLQGVLTGMDFLKYLYKVASPFVMVSEIELALRALIRVSVSQDQLAACIANSLGQIYQEQNRPLPQALEEMTFDNYHSLIAHGRNWEFFKPVFGGTRERTSGKLKEVGKLRNDLFHFKRELTMQDHETLANHRDWILLKAREADARRKGGQP